MSEVRVIIHGAGGRMGQRLVALGQADPELKIVAALEHADHPWLGRDAGTIAGIEALQIPLTTEFEVGADAMIDFSVPASAVAAAGRCAEAGIGLVLATTGLDAAQRQEIESAAQAVPVVWAPNMSRAVNLTMKLATQVAAALKSDPHGADVEIIERHHRYKEDAPSGTALRFGELIAGEMGQERHQHGRQGQTGQRPRDEIGYHALRVGDNPGEHTIVFGLLGETIELTVRSTNRDSYALGALAAARFVAGRPPGIYSMFDVLGF